MGDNLLLVEYFHMPKPIFLLMHVSPPEVSLGNFLRAIEPGDGKQELTTPISNIAILPLMSSMYVLGPQEEKKGNRGMCCERNSRIPIANGRKQEVSAISYTMSDNE